MADEDDRAADPAARCLHQGDVLCRCVEAVLRCNTLMPLRLKGNDQLAEARAVGPEPVTENDAGFGLRRCHFALLCCPSRTPASTGPEDVSHRMLKLGCSLAEFCCFCCLLLKKLCNRVVDAAPLQTNYFSSSEPSTSGHRFSKSTSRCSPRSNRVWTRCCASGHVSAVSKEVMASRSRSADGSETWLTRFFAAAMARRSKEAIRRASASTKPSRSATGSARLTSPNLYEESP